MNFARLEIIIVTATIAVTMAACSQFQPRDKRFYYRALWNFALIIPDKVCIRFPT